MKHTVVVCVEDDRKAVNYLDALKEMAVDHEDYEVVTAASERDDLIRLGAEAAGLVLCGGPDIEPHHYGEEPRPDAGLSLDPMLDKVELELIEGARSTKRPVWAICRGLQTVNVAMGGTLWQDLPSQLPDTQDHYVHEPLDHLAHTIEVRQNTSAFGDLLAGEEVLVNTRHHQAIKELAPGLSGLAHSPDGVLEVIESTDDEWWMRGVQWHPENLLALPLQRRLWKDFLDRAVGRAEDSGAPASSGK